jgi:serine/threonine-protein kinase
MQSAIPGSAAGLDLTGKILGGDFHVLRLLGQGGMGQVYLAEQLALKRKVALKILRPELAADTTAVERFKAEALAVARLTHGNIVQVYTVGTDNGITFMALEYVEGRTLRDLLIHKGPPELLPVLRIMIQAASALQRAGELGIVHRDIKPENILLTRKGEVKVADFGLSRCLAGDQPALNLTQSGVTLGTPLYMSPEQVQGKTVDVRTDIYSFGVTCYHLLAGQPPFLGETAFEVALQHVQSEPAPLAGIRPDLPAPLCALVHKMMAKDPGQRHQTGRELLRDLLRLRDSLSGQTGALALSPSAVQPAAAGSGSTPSSPGAISSGSKRMALLGVFAGSVVLALASGAALGWLDRQGRAVPRHAVAVAEEPDPLLHHGQDEKSLQAVVDHYLSTPIRADEVGMIASLCLDLGLLYLEQDRLDEAGKLFTRLERSKLEGNKKAPQLRFLGIMGQAIVVALEHPADEPAQAIKARTEKSNQLFHQALTIFPHPGQKVAPRWENLLQNNLHRLGPWIGRAIHHNLANGLERSQLPPRLLQMYPQP